MNLQKRMNRKSKTITLITAVIYLVILSLLLNTISAAPPLEDYTDGYSISDPNSDLTVSANRIEVDTMRRDANTYVCKDFGAAYFKNWTINFDWQVNASADWVELWAVGVSNIGNDNWYMCRNDIFCVGAFYSPDWNHLMIYLHRSHPYGGVYWLLGFDYNTHYWCVFKRYGNALWIEFYTDAERTVLDYNLSTSCWQEEDWSGRYLYAQQGQGVASFGANTITGFIQNHQILDPLPQVYVDVKSSPQTNFAVNASNYRTPQTDLSLDQYETHSFTAPDTFIQGSQIYYFEYWLINGSTTSTDNPLVTVLNGNTTLRMYWDSNLQRAIGITAPYAYIAINIMSISLIIGVGAVFITCFQTQDMAALIPVVIVGIGVTIALFIVLPLLNAFSGL